MKRFTLFLISIGFSILGFGQPVQEMVTNGNFATSTSGWIITSTNTNRLQSGRSTMVQRGNWTFLRVYRSSTGNGNPYTGTSITITSSQITGVQPNNGYIRLTFDVNLRSNGNNTNLSVQTSTTQTGSYTTWLSLSKNNATTATATTSNSAIFTSYQSPLASGVRMPNDSFTSVTLLIPATVAFSGYLRFSYVAGATSNGNDNNGNYLDITNISITSLSTPAASNCTQCLFNWPLDEGTGFTELKPVPECGQSEESVKYLYYLPAVAAQPASQNSVNGNPPGQIVITSEVDNVALVITRPDGSPVTTGTVSSTSPYSYSTTMADMFTTDTLDIHHTTAAPATHAGYSGNTKGYIISASQPVSIRWRWNNGNNREQVVLRGATALGNAFRAASVMHAEDTADPNGVHYFTVMSTQDGPTHVQVGNPNDSSSVILITLANKGDQFTGISNVKSVSGLLILSDQLIAVVSGQQHRRIYNGSTSLEGTDIQVAPFRGLGNNYLNLSTQGYDGYQVVAVENGTAVYQNGNLVTVLNAGEAFQMYGVTPTASLDGVPYRISTSQNAYVYTLGSNNIGEFELFPAPPMDLPVGKAGKIIYTRDQGKDGWVIINTSDVGKLQRNGSSNLGQTRISNLAAGGGATAKTVYYWADSTFTPQASNDFTCIGCDVMYVGQLNDGKSAGTQVGYITSFDFTPIQFFNTEFLPQTLLTNGYNFDTINYHVTPVPAPISHTITLASSGGVVTIDSIRLSRESGSTDTGNVVSISNKTFVLNVPTTAIGAGEIDTVNVKVFVSDETGNSAALCLSYILENTIPTPVKLLSFTATKLESTSLLNWVTTAESENKGFGIQRSGDGKNWQEIGFVNAVDYTNQDLTNNYTFTDRKPLVGNNFYRLRQVDINGATTFSQVVILNFPDGQMITVSPNPTRDFININGLKGAYQLNVVDVMGRRVLSQNQLNVDGNYRLDVASLADGIYSLNLVNQEGKLQTFKIQVMH